MDHINRYKSDELLLSNQRSHQLSRGRRKDQILQLEAETPGIGLQSGTTWL